MPGIEFFGLNLPFYVFIILLLSYLIWSKFLNNSKLGIKDVDDILDIITLFTFIFVLLMGTIIFFLLVGALVNLDTINLAKVWEGITSVVAFLGVLIIIVFISFYRHRTYRIEQGGKRQLKKIVTHIMVFYLFLGVFFISMYASVLLTVLRYALRDMIGLLPFVVYLILFAYWLVNVTLFKIHIKRDILTKGVITVSVIIFMITLLFGLLFMPIIKYEEPTNLGYHIYSPDHYWGGAYLRQSVPINIKTFGIAGSIIHLIPVNYGLYEFDTKDRADKNFELLINISKEKNLRKFINSFEEVRNLNKKELDRFSFTSLVLDQKRKLITLKFNERTIKEEQINQIILNGYIKKNMSELDYSYYDNSQYTEVCYGTGCSILFNITNNLNLPVYHEEETLINFNNRNVINKTNCRFTNISSNFPSEGDIRILDPICYGNSCELQIRDMALKKNIFDMQLFIDGDVVRLHYIDIYEPIQVDAKFNLVC